MKSPPLDQLRVNMAKRPVLDKAGLPIPNRAHTLYMQNATSRNVLTCFPRCNTKCAADLLMILVAVVACGTRPTGRRTTKKAQFGKTKNDYCTLANTATQPHKPEIAADGCAPMPALRRRGGASAGGEIAGDLSGAWAVHERVRKELENFGVCPGGSA